jgi:hypothetical protein
MKAKILFLTTALIMAVFLAPGVEAQNKGFSKDDLKKMSTFLSNFTELGFMNFTTREMTNPQDPADMIRFGIGHNYVNNYKSRIKKCTAKSCPHGSLMIEGRYVSESIKKYFDVDYSKLASVMDSDPPYYYDGKNYHFEGADGEAVWYARVDEAKADSSGQVTMRGVVYNADSDNGADIYGPFEAVAKPHVFNGKQTWAIITFKAEYKE